MMTELWQQIVKIGLRNFSKRCNIELKQKETKIKIPLVSKPFFFNRQSSGLLQNCI